MHDGMVEPGPLIDDVAAAVQEMVRADKWEGAAAIVEKHESELLSDTADAILAHQATLSAGNQNDLIEYEDWRGFLSSCRRDGYDAAVERHTRLTGLRRVAAAGGVEGLKFSMQALELIDEDVQPVIHALHAGEVALAGVRTENTVVEIRVAAVLLAHCAETLARNEIVPRWLQYQAGVGDAYTRIYGITRDASDLTHAVEAFDTAGFYLLDKHVRTADPVPLGGALMFYEGALERVSNDDSLWPQRRYHVALVHHFRFGVTNNREDIDEAVSGCEEALAALAESDPQHSTFLNDLALWLHDRYTTFGDPSDLDRAIDIQQKLIDADATDAARSNILGMILHSRFQLVGDVDDLHRSIALIQQAMDSEPRDSQEWARYAMNFGVALRSRFRSLGALEDIDRAVDTERSSLGVEGSDAHDVTLRTYNLALCLLSRFEATARREDIDDAIAAFQASADGPQERRTPTYEADLGVALRRRFEAFHDPVDLEAAVGRLAAALGSLPLGTSEWARVSANLGVAYKLAAEDDEDPSVIDAAVSALTLAAETEAALVHDRAFHWFDLAGALELRYRRRADPADLAAAEAAYRRSFAPFEDGRWPDLTVDVARSLGRLLLLIGNRDDEASRLLTRGMDAIEELYRAQLLIADRQSWLAHGFELHALAAVAVVRAGEPAAAAEALERSRARTLGEALERDRADLAEVARANPVAHSAYTSAAARLRQLEQTEAEATRQRAPDIRAEVARARADLDAAVGQIRLVPGFERFLATPGLDDVADAVVDGRALAYIAVTRAGSAILLCHRTSGEMTIEAPPAGPLTHDELIALLVGDPSSPGLLSAQFGAFEGLDDALRRLLDRLGHALIAPLASRLAELNVKAVTLVACGLLGIVPLHAASREEEGESVYLLDPFVVAYAPSATTLAAADRAAAAASARAKSFAAAANPWPVDAPLTHAEAEADVAAALFAGTPTIVRRRHEARADVLMGDIDGASHVHFACHAFYVPDDPLSSHLLLADGTQLALGDLLARRRFDRVRLVVASACQTAIADFKRLPEEALGLPGGFLQAGAAAVMGTLWPVADISTALLVERFYELHVRDALPPAAALAGAQRWLRTVTAGELAARFDSRLASNPTPAMAEAAAHGAALFGLKDPNDKPYSRRPWSWAPFILVGA